MTERSSVYPLHSPLRTREAMEWIHDRYKVDALERLARSTPDYYETHGNYLPDVSALAHAALLALEDERAMAEQSIETLRDLHKNWRRIIDEQDADGDPLIENLLYWLIEDLGGKHE